MKLQKQTEEFFIKEFEITNEEIFEAIRASKLKRPRIFKRHTSCNITVYTEKDLGNKKVQRVYNTGYCESEVIAGKRCQSIIINLPFNEIFTKAELTREVRIVKPYTVKGLKVAL